MRIISSAARAALASGRFRVRCLLRADVEDGPFCVWDDAGQISVGDVVYHGAAGRFRIGKPTSVADLSVRNVDVVFSGLDLEVAALMEAGGWHQRPVSIARLVLAEDAPQVVHVVPVFSGFIDQMIRRDVPEAQLIFRCEATARELNRRGVRTRSDADQRQRDGDDAFFAFTAIVGQEPLEWGRNPSSAGAQPQRKKLFGIF